MARMWSFLRFRQQTIYPPQSLPEEILHIHYILVSSAIDWNVLYWQMIVSDFVQALAGARKERACPDLLKVAR